MDNIYISPVPIQEIIKASPNGNLKDLYNLSSMKLVEKYIRPFYNQIKAARQNSDSIMI